MTGFAGTEEVRAALAQARAEAVELRNEYIGTEHLLLGLITPPSRLVSGLLASRNVDTIQIREAVEAIVRRGPTTPGPDLPYTSSSKRILEFAMSEARELSAGIMNTGDVFLGIVQEEKGIGAQVLSRLGFTLDASRQQYVLLMAEGHGERVIGQGDRLMARAPHHEMPPMAAAAAFQMMLRSPRVAAVLEQHHVDVQAIIRDLSALPPT